MIDSYGSAASFIEQSTSFHSAGLDAYGKRYKQFSNAALTTIFERLADSLDITTAIEVGAFQADFSRRFLERKSGRTALAVEANPYNYHAFRDRVTGAGIIYHHAAVQDLVGTRTLQLMVTDIDVKNGYIRGNNSILTSQQRPETQPLKVPATTLDTLVEEYVKSEQLPPLSDSPPVLWIDVEGALDLVIAGGEQTISESLAIFAEVESTALWDRQAVFSDICKQLQALEFRPFLRDCEYEPEQFNVVFINQKLDGNSLLLELEQQYSDILTNFTG